MADPKFQRYGQMAGYGMRRVVEAPGRFGAAVGRQAAAVGTQIAAPFKEYGRGFQQGLGIIPEAGFRGKGATGSYEVTSPPVSAGLQPAVEQVAAPPVSAGLRPAVVTTEVIRGEQPAQRYDFALGEGGFAKRTPTGGQFNFATEAELKNVPRGKVAWIDENTYVDESGTYNRIEGGRIFQGGKTWQAEQTPAGVVFRDLRTGAVFGSALEAERGNAIDILEGGAKADALKAEARLRGVQADVLPMEAASQAGLRSTQGGYYRNLGEAALMNQAPAAGLRDMLYDVSSVQTDATGMPVTVKQTYMQTPQGFRPVINQGNNALIQEAEQAIANGADPEKVRRRLRELLAE